MSPNTCMNLECTAKQQFMLVDVSMKILDIVMGLLIFAPPKATMSLQLCQARNQPLLDAPERQR